jgi:pescadillo protein
MLLLPIAKYSVGAALPPHLSPWVDNEEEGYKPAYAEEIERLKAGESVDTVDAEKEADDESSSSSDAEMEGQEEVDDNSTADQSSDEVEATDKGGTKGNKKRKKKRKKQDEEDEAKELARSMMSRKAAHLYGRMQHGITQKKQKAEELQRRRKDIEGKKKDDTGKTVLKQKVERLKEERKSIENQYAETGGSMKKKKRTK